jgi:urease accessory protein
MTFLEVPSRFEKYGDHQAASGKARILLSCNNSSKTAIEQLETKAPLLVQRALYPDTGQPNMAHLYLMSSAGGVLQGDRLEIEIRANENAMARITTQSATKIYRMDKGYALQNLSITAADDSYIEYMPRQLIPYRSSRYCQFVTITASPSSTVLYSETLSAGRIASGERFDFDACFLGVQTYGLSGQLYFSDVCSIEPAIDSKATFELLFGRKKLWSTIFIITPQSNRDIIQKEILDAIEKSSILAGCTSLPHDSGLVVRMLEDSIDRIDEMISIVAGITRNHAMVLKKKR